MFTRPDKLPQGKAAKTSIRPDNLLLRPERLLIRPENLFIRPDHLLVRSDRFGCNIVFVRFKQSLSEVLLRI